MKYIVEFEDEPCMYEDEVHFYKCIQAPWWGLSERVIKQLTPYQPDIAPDTNVGNITNSCAHEKDHNADIGKKAEKEDCISRQAALNAITDELMSSTPLSEVIRAKNRLKDLPSAQPDLSGYSDRLWKNAYERGKAEALDARWTPCSERLPEAKQRVLVTFPDGTVDIKICIDAGHLKWFFAHMVAWMPLPAPYKGGDAE